MIAILWTYDVREEFIADFVAAYGPAGAWAELFVEAEGFLGVELLRGEDGRYLTIDKWASKADFEAFLAQRRAAYDALDDRTASWTRLEQRIGMFHQV